MIAGELRAKLLRQLRGQAGLQDNAPATHQYTRRRRCGGRRRDRMAWLRCPWAAAGPGRTTSQRTEPHASTPGPTGMEGAGGTGGPGCGAGGRRRGQAKLRADAPIQMLAGGPPPTSTPGAAGVKGAGGICRGAGGRWRGQAGLRGDAPSEARGADGSRAAGPTGAQNTSGATRHIGTTKPPSPTGAGRLRQSAREGQRRITTMSGSPRPLS